MKKDSVKTNIELKDEVINPILENMEKILQPENRHLLSYFLLKPHDQINGVDVAILNGLLKSLKTRKINLNKGLSELSLEEQRREESKYKAQLKL